jgi:hypothetical protein
VDAFSYVATFIALIPALALTRLLGGLADLVQLHLGGERRVRWSGLFLVWVFNLVLYNAYEWWLIYSWRSQAPFHFWIFAFLLVKPSILLFIARLWMPDVERDSRIDLEEHYFRVLRWVIPMLAAYVLLDIPDTLLHGVAHFESLGGLRYAGILLVWVLLLYPPLLLTRRRWVHWLVWTVGMGFFVILQLTLNTAAIG